MKVTRFKLTAFLEDGEPYIEYGSPSLSKEEFLHLAEVFYEYLANK